MLSISTIASAIADASMSTEPSQLAAMIMELSKRSRNRNRPEPARPVGSAATITEEKDLDEHVRFTECYLIASILSWPSPCVAIKYTHLVLWDLNGIGNQTA